MPSSSFLRSIGVAALVACLAGTSTPALAQAGAEDAAMRYLRDNKQQFKLTGSDLNEVVVSSTSTDAATGVTHVYLQQRYRGIDVWNGIVTVNVRPDGSVLFAGSRFYSNLAAEAKGQSAKKAAADAARAAAEHVNLRPTRPIQVVARKARPTRPH